VQWQQAYAGAFDEPGFSPVKLGPVLAHDGTRFFTGMVRQENGSDTHRLFVYRSDDGVTWQPETSHGVPVDGTAPKLRLAVRGNGTMVAAVFGDTTSVLLRRSNVWTGLNLGNVFGDDPLPDADNFALITAGQPRVPLFVNQTSTGQEDAQSRPFDNRGGAADRTPATPSRSRTTRCTPPSSSWCRGASHSRHPVRA
jgi:hypothetical protein